MPVHDSAVAWTDGGLQHLSKHILHVENLSELVSGPRSEQRGAGADYDWCQARSARVPGGVESEGIEPNSVAGSPQRVLLLAGEEAAGGGVGAAPFLGGVDGCPFVGDTANFYDLLEKGERLGGQRARDVWRLAGIVGYEANGFWEWAELGFCCLVEDWNAMGGGEEGVEVVVGCCEGEAVGNGKEGVEDVEEGLVGEVGQLHVECM